MDTNDPQDPIDVLMDEHRLIEGVLQALGAWAGGPAPAMTPAGLSRFCRFFQGYVQSVHHGKEEEILFRRLVQGGLSSIQGPLRVMHHEHERGAALIGELLGYAQRPAWSPEDRDAVAGHAREYARLLKRHIVKEDEVLYPMAWSVLREADLQDLAARFAAHDRDVEDLEALQLQAAALVQEYPGGWPEDALDEPGPHDGCAAWCDRLDCMFQENLDDVAPWMRT